MSLRHVQLNGAAFDSPTAQDHRQIAHAQQESEDFRLDPGPGALRVVQNCRHLLIRETPPDANGGVGEVRLGALAGGRKVHEGAFDVAYVTLLQAGQAIRDDLGKHRQHAPGQVDARAALPRLAVQRAPRRREMSDVGDMDA